MEFHTIYFLWALFPLFFFLFSIWAVLKRWGGVPGREYPWEYIRQGVFCALALVATILFDQYVLKPNTGSIFFLYVEESVARFLLYPAALVGAAYLQSLVADRKDSERVTHRRFAR